MADSISPVFDSVPQITPQALAQGPSISDQLTSLGFGGKGSGPGPAATPEPDLAPTAPGSKVGLGALAPASNNSSGTPLTPDSGNLVDHLSSKGMDTSPQARANLYEQNGLGKSSDYLSAYNDAASGKGDNSSLDNALVAKLQGGSGPSIISSDNVMTQYKANSTALDNALKLINANFTPPNQNGASTSTPGGQPDTTPVTLDTVSPTDPYISALNTLSARSNDSTRSMISSIQAAMMQKTNATNAQYDAYKRGLQSLGISTNEAESTPDLLSGHIVAAANDQQTKLDAITAEETKAIMDAETARDNKDFKTLQEKMAYVKTLNDQKQTALKNYYNAITQDTKISGDVAHNVYSTMTTLDPKDQETFIQGVAKQYGLPVGNLVTALNDEKQKQDTAALKEENTKSIIAKRGGGGTGSGSISKTAISSFGQKLEESRGDDGYTDPNLYAQGAKDWVSQGGTLKTFVSNFPPADYMNPANTTLPKYLMPKVTKSSGSSSSRNS